MTSILADRRSSSEKRLDELQKQLIQAPEICAGKACVYVTGSFGRGEAGRYSDLDIFIVGRSHADDDGKEIRELSNLEEIRLKAELIDGTGKLAFPPFSGDGEFLRHYTIEELVRTTGKPEDDANNTFTARLLLLLESRPLIGADVYADVIGATISQYWRDYDGREAKYVPAFLANDILRLWRTFCVNYEARTSDVPEKKKNKRRLKNYKLKYSRMLTCYSALLHLLALQNTTGTATPDDIREMVAMSPTQRLEWLLSIQEFESAHDMVRDLLAKYAEFLNNTNEFEDTLLARISDRATRIEYFQHANAFGDAVFELIESVGRKCRLHRLLVV